MLIRYVTTPVMATGGEGFRWCVFEDSTHPTFHAESRGNVMLIWHGKQRVMAIGGEGFRWCVFDDSTQPTFRMSRTRKTPTWLKASE